MKKVKLCILQNGLARGGTDTFVVNLCRGLDKSKYDIVVVNPSNKLESREREPEVLATGARVVHTHPLSGLIGILKHLFVLYRLLKRGNYDVFQTNIDLFNGPQLLVAWLAGVPVRCCHSHNTMQQKSIVHGMSWSIRWYQRLMKWMCWTFSNRRSGCSADAMDFLFEGKPWRSAIYPTIINNGIDIAKFRRLIDVEKKKAELGLKARYNIVTVGRIIPQKNPLFIAECFSALCKIRNDVDLVWVGIGDLEHECKRILQDNNCLDNVHFLGLRTDVAEIMQCCDLFLMPSIFEGLGIVIVEAQTAGLNCLVSDAVPKEANCGGVIYKSLSNDKESWAWSMCDMLDAKKKQLIIEKMIQHFSIENMVNQMEKVFKK